MNNHGGHCGELRLYRKTCVCNHRVLVNAGFNSKRGQTTPAKVIQKRFYFSASRFQAA
ncbi:hypothetical protein GCWU000324_02376 [Kingella oralis ATCC 51147]|uniref:Uncharacterized protein n=1 Tax=Kingella oralis ATCC 51147 TaxID=629741 RepID=C4GK02_9NEIS|nr:hypothetical protein GCWU000324_02376 [Kingella oralis ATCC 51147]